MLKEGRPFAGHQTRRRDSLSKKATVRHLLTTGKSICANGKQTARGRISSRACLEDVPQRPRRRPGRGTTVGRTALEGKAVHIPDVLADPEYTFFEAQKLGQYRANLAVPLLREGNPIGALSLTRLEPLPFTAKQIELVETFADQAVIAIENARLFDEVQVRTRELSQSVAELSALGEVSQAVNSSVDLETVLTTIVAKATQLSNTEAGAIYVFNDDSRLLLPIRTVVSFCSPRNTLQACYRNYP